MKLSKFAVKRSNFLTPPMDAAETKIPILTEHRTKCDFACGTITSQAHKMTNTHRRKLLIASKLKMFVHSSVANAFQTSEHSLLAIGNQIGLSNSFVRPFSGITYMNALRVEAATHSNIDGKMNKSASHCLSPLVSFCFYVIK